MYASLTRLDAHMKLLKSTMRARNRRRSILTPTDVPEHHKQIWRALLRMASVRQGIARALFGASVFHACLVLRTFRMIDTP